MENVNTKPCIPPNETFSKKREEKNRRKDLKTRENILKLLANVPESDRIEFLIEKYVELYRDFRNANQNNKILEQQLCNVQKDKNYLETEQAKCVLAKDRLENLCRELQRQNKEIKDENFCKIRNEEDRRRQLATTFSEKFHDITTMIDKNNEKSNHLQDENIKMATKLAELYQQFKDREEHLTKMSEQMELQKRLSEATVTKMEEELKIEKEIWDNERESLKSNLKQSQSNCEVLQKNVNVLQEQIDLYKTQYAEFETTMTKSNKLFKNFKGEMSKMTKQILIVEKEAAAWKNKWQVSANSLIKLSEMHQLKEAELRASEKKIAMLGNLCRQLQEDRSLFLKLLKLHGIQTTMSAFTEDTEDIYQASINENNFSLSDKVGTCQDKYREELESSILEDKETINNNFEIFCDQTDVCEGKIEHQDNFGSSSTNGGEETYVNSNNRIQIDDKIENADINGVNDQDNNEIVMGSGDKKHICNDYSENGDVVEIF